MSFIIQKYTLDHRNDWNNFLANCKNSHFIFNRAFMEYHSDRYEDCSLIASDSKGKFVALFPGNLLDDIFYSHQGLTFGGFLVDKRLHVVDLLEIFELIKDFLKNLGVRRIVYKAIPSIYHQYPAEEDLYVLFRNNAQIYRRDVSSCIDMTQEYKYSKGRRWGVNKAKKLGVECRELNQPSEVWTVIREVLSEQYKTEPVHNESEIDYLKKKFPNHIKAYAAYLSGMVVAVCITFQNSQVIHTQYLACRNEGREVCALDLLIDFVISEGLGNARFFDFGISNEDNGNYLNRGLVSQKESFGARAIVHDFYSLEI